MYVVEQQEALQRDGRSSTQTQPYCERHGAIRLKSHELEAEHIEVTASSLVFLTTVPPHIRKDRPVRTPPAHPYLITKDTETFPTRITRILSRLSFIGTTV
jgi:hypothetical protein